VTLENGPVIQEGQEVRLVEHHMCGPGS
jgi:hypothetical protein